MLSRKTVADLEAEEQYEIDETMRAFHGLDARLTRLQAFVAKHPDHRDAPRFLEEIAEITDALADIIAAATATRWPRLVEAARQLATVTVH